MDLITVIIVNWNGRHLLPDCLKSLQEQKFKKFNTIIVDNGSSDGSVEWLSGHHPEVRVVPLSSNRGFCAANNVGYRLVKTKYVALLNNDAVAHPLWLGRLVEALEKNSEAGFAASKILNFKEPEIIDRAGDSYTRAGVGLLRGRGMSFQDYEKQEWIFGACAAAALYDKRMIDEIGFFDEDFFLLYEDVDLSFRAQLKGYKCLYVPEATGLSQNKQQYCQRFTYFHLLWTSEFGVGLLSEHVERFAFQDDNFSFGSYHGVLFLLFQPGTYAQYSESKMGWITPYKRGLEKTSPNSRK